MTLVRFTGPIFIETCLFCSHITNTVSIKLFIYAFLKTKLLKYIRHQLSNNLSSVIEDYRIVLKIERTVDDQMNSHSKPKYQNGTRPINTVPFQTPKSDRNEVCFYENKIPSLSRIHTVRTFIRGTVRGHNATFRRYVGFLVTCLQPIHHPLNPLVPE